MTTDKNKKENEEGESDSCITSHYQGEEISEMDCRGKNEVQNRNLGS